MPEPGSTEKAPAAFPWARPRHELLLLALVSVATLAVMVPSGAQDISRLCLTRSLTHGHLSADSCLSAGSDRAEFGGNLYSDKAPALSFFGVPAQVILRLQSATVWPKPATRRLWLMRVWAGGIFLIGCALLVGRVAEGLAPGWGGGALVTFAAGTLAGSLAVASFDEVPAAAVGFAAFLLAWRGRPASAGLAAGLLPVVEYQAAFVVVALAAFAAVAGRRALGRYLLGVVPGVLLLGLYDRLAFGSPFHLSYRYVGAQFAAQQASGFFGIHAPRLHAIRVVLVGDRGLLVDAPILVLAAAGLVLLWRRGYRPQAAICAAVTLGYLALEFGYFDPFGGDSPGPRFFAPALPFLAIGLGPAFARWRASASVLAVLGVVSSTAIALTWFGAANTALHYHWSVWRELALFPLHGASSQLARWAPKTMLGGLHIGPLGAMVAVFAAALAAIAIALRDGWLARPPAPIPVQPAPQLGGSGEKL
ncbi:MAG TPA: hypothetical protein VGM80_10855 [Gaiellaceae bacterium]